jgi:hypothetical protein
MRQARADPQDGDAPLPRRAALPGPAAPDRAGPLLPPIFWIGYYDDVVVKGEDGEYLFEQRIATKWEGEILSKFPVGLMLMDELAGFNDPVDTY